MLEPLEYRRIPVGVPLKPFDCGNADLNDFFHKDAKDYASQLLAVTYAFETDDLTVAFFSVLNDAIYNKDSHGQRITNKLTRRIPNPKRRPTFPSVKIGRFGICKDYQRNGVGTAVITFIKHLFTASNITGCRFVTVDAYAEVVEFYRKCGFHFLHDADRRDDTRQMWFDLKTFSPD
ncbi:MAG: GNAT family N-acetyltransferase [Nitrospirae bacterium]|nr:GNAT family N-acetyltransferase [Nitrospirota bacterium]